MNLKYHIGVAIIGELVFKTGGLFLIGAILPDLSLIYNEIKININGTNFDATKIDNYSFITYHIAHSLFISILLLYFNLWIGLGHLLHIIPDWFSHTGIFSAMPFYPISKYKIKFGKEILK